MPGPNSAKTFLPDSQHGVKGSPASQLGTHTHCRLPPLLHLWGRNEEGKQGKRLWRLLSLADGFCHVRGPLTPQDLPKHSSLCLIRRENYRAAWVSISIILWWRRKSPYQSKLSASEQWTNPLHAWSCRVHGRHSPRSYLETLCFINRAGWGPPLPSPHTPNL